MEEFNQIKQLINEFRNHLETEEGKKHLKYLKEKEPYETREILEKLKTLPKESNEFVDLVLYGLLPHSDTKYAKRVSAAPAFMNVKKFFARFRYTENDWKELANLIFNLVVKFESSPERLDEFIREFVSNRLSKGLQCGSISPIFFALNNKFPIVNNRTIRTYRKLSSIIFNQPDELNQKLEYYLANVEKIKHFVKTLSERYNFKEIEDLAIFDLFCFWYDEYKMKEKKAKEIKDTSENIASPIDESSMTKLFQSLGCSEPQPFFVAVGPNNRNLKKLDEEGKIIYNTEFQRDEVWDKNRQQKLIDSILRGYSINTIYLRQLPDGRFECLDGQQRLKTILRDFLEDKIPINPKITPEFNRETYFSELPEVLKNKIRIYQIFAIIFYTADDEETCKIFLRLQEGLPLNSAEKLNAMRGFLRNEIIELSQHPFIEKLGIRNYRFSHRYIVAQVYLLTLRNQITDVKFRNLQEAYTTYGTVRPPSIVSNVIKKVLNFLDKEFGEDAEIIKDRADFISLYLLAKYLIENYVIDSNIKLKEFLLDFLEKVERVESSEDEGDVPYYDYKTYKKTSADSRSSIEKRFNIILSKFLEFNQTLVPKDPKRDFNYWEKLAIYRRDKGICQICGKKTTFEEGVVDHKDPHSKGGKTIIENGQWCCKECNLRKSNKVENKTNFMS